MKKWGVVLAVAALVAVAACDTARSEIGVGVIWDGNGITPNMVLPIKMASGMLFEPVLGFDKIDANSVTEQLSSLGVTAGTEIRGGLRFEKPMKTEGTTPLFGASAMLHFFSPDNGDLNEDDNGYEKSTMNFSLGVFVGGSAKLADGVDIVGTWGPTVDIYGKEKGTVNGEKDQVIRDSATNFGSRASLTLRFWLWGVK